jgi:hypothetical protein
MDGDDSVLEVDEDVDEDVSEKAGKKTGPAKKVRNLYQQADHLKVECGRFVPIMRRRRCGL